MGGGNLQKSYSLISHRGRYYYRTRRGNDTNTLASSPHPNSVVIYRPERCEDMAPEGPLYL